MRIVFKNMKSSDFAKTIIKERFSSIVEKYPSLKGHKITLTMEMDNSPTQAGPDHFNASVIVSGEVYKIRIKRSSRNLYLAIANLAEQFNQLISRETDRLLKPRHREGKVEIMKFEVVENGME